MIFAGIEGGATHSKLIFICTYIENGKIEKIFEEEGQSLNCVIQGADFTCDYIAKWIQISAQKLGLNLPLEGVGLGLAGAGNTQITQKISGVVIIAGTGSACRYLNNSGRTFQTGGNGHLIEDSGGGFWIAQKAIQTIFNHEEGLELSNFPIEFLKQLIMKYFKLNEFRDILNIFYGPNFSKAFVASFCKIIAEYTEQDPLCKHLFEQAGEALAQKLIAISRNFDNEMFQNVSVLLVGSVFQSWNILKFGFVKTLQTKPSKIKQLSFYKLKENAALGAAIFVLKNSEIFFDFDFNTTEFIDSIVLSVV
uniref:N-acetylglucosamine kinase n=1 Tax=Panagrolaimus sp. PS1159 TaxID=55785 RepID=A0AC35G059_9BILA